MRRAVAVLAALLAVALVGCSGDPEPDWDGYLEAVTATYDGADVDESMARDLATGYCEVLEDLTSEQGMAYPDAVVYIAAQSEDQERTAMLVTAAQAFICPDVAE